MIKLINYKGNIEGKVIYLAKSSISEMRRNDEEGTTHIWSNGLQPVEYVVGETPEEILAMPDIEEGIKTIDWEQRRYEIAKHILPQMSIVQPMNTAENAVRFADALIDKLKGGEK